MLVIDGGHAFDRPLKGSARNLIEGADTMDGHEGGSAFAQTDCGT